MAADVALAPAATWTGIYCGGGGGGDWGKFNIESHIYESGGAEHYGNGPPNSSYDDAWNPVAASVQGPFITAICGADQQVGSNAVVGLFADVDLQDKRGKFENYHPWYSDPYTFQGQRWSVQLGTTATIAARAGVLLSPDILLFGIAGWSWADASLAYFGGCEPSPPLANCGDIVGSARKTISGPTFGAGIEAMLGDHWSGRIEYRATSLGKITANSASVPASPYPGWTGIATAAVSDQSARLTLIYRP